MLVYETGRHSDRLTRPMWCVLVRNRAQSEAGDLRWKVIGITPSHDGAEDIERNLAKNNPMLEVCIQTAVVTVDFRGAA